MNLQETIKALELEAVKHGRLIEAGWLSMRLAAIAPNAPQEQLDGMRVAFFAGAQHLFSSILTILDEDREPTDADLSRMSMIQSELDSFIDEYKKAHL